MKNWKKYALASASVIALGATLAVETLQGSKKSATTSSHQDIPKVTNQITDVLLKCQQDH